MARSEGSGDEDEGNASSPNGTSSPRGVAGDAGNYSEQGALEDPEAEYWRRNTAVPKNSNSVAKELAQQLQSAVATKKLDIGELEPNMIPDKVFELDGLRILWAQANNIQVLPRLIGRSKDLTPGCVSLETSCGGCPMRWGNALRSRCCGFRTTTSSRCQVP